MSLRGARYSYDPIASVSQLTEKSKRSPQHGLTKWRPMNAPFNTFNQLCHREVWSAKQSVAFVKAGEKENQSRAGEPEGGPGEAAQIPSCHDVLENTSMRSWKRMPNQGMEDPIEVGC